jgi:putative multiple sugar transport system substrate-binding protein
MKKNIIPMGLVVMSILAFVLVACGGGAGGGDMGDGSLIGVVFRTASIGRDQAFVTAIRNMGYTPDVVSPVIWDDQTEQDVTLRGFLTAGARLIMVQQAQNTVITVVHEAAMAGVPVIALDDEILNTVDYDYRITFDNELVGRLQGNAIIYKLGLASGSGPFNIVLFAGDEAIDDSNALEFYDGAIGVLAPYISAGKLNVIGPYPANSSDSTYTSICLDWNPATAKSKMENRLTLEPTIHAVLAPNDDTAGGIIEALQENATYTGKTIANGFPIVTGQDRLSPAIDRINAGTQYMTVFKDPAAHARVAADLAHQILTGRTPSLAGIPFIQKYNGSKNIKTWLVSPVSITKDDL